MPRSMLQLRMKALQRHLKEAEDPSTWKNQLGLQIVVDKVLWNKAVEMIHWEARTQRRKLEKAMRELDGKTGNEQKGWREYGAIRSESEAIFRECLELLGGLALRDRIHEEYICRFGDALIRELATAVARPSWFAIPAIDQTLSSTLRRVASVPFPEWHLWTLPLVAHEYAQVLIEKEHQGLGDFVDKLARQLLEAASNEEQADSGAESTIGRQAAGTVEMMVTPLQRRVRILLADAFATYTTGPAYACAALILRVSPLAIGTEDRPSGQERAAMILGVLQAMTPKLPPSFKTVVADLRQYWKDSVMAAGGMAGAAGKEPETPATELVAPSETIDAAGDTDETATGLESPISPGEVIDEFMDWFVRTNIAYAKDDWNVAVRWSDAWLRQLEDPESELTMPDEIKPDQSLRDALNACWRCRAVATRDFGPDEAERAEIVVEQIERVGRNLCETVIEKSRRGDSGEVSSKEAPRP